MRFGDVGPKDLFSGSWSGNENACRWDLRVTNICAPKLRLSVRPPALDRGQQYQSLGLLEVVCPSYGSSSNQQSESDLRDLRPCLAMGGRRSRSRKELASRTAAGD